MNIIRFNWMKIGCLLVLYDFTVGLDKENFQLGETNPVTWVCLPTTNICKMELFSDKRDIIYCLKYKQHSNFIGSGTSLCSSACRLVGQSVCLLSWFQVSPPMLIGALVYLHSHLFLFLVNINWLNNQ